MPLLHRIAISNGDQWRKDEATRAIIAMEGDTVKNWNQSLETTISHKREGVLNGSTQKLGQKSRDCQR
jgi:hypothetical protein